MPQVTIGCRLPHGLIIRHPNPEIKAQATIAGIHSSKLVNRDGSPAASFVTTSIDQELWDAWKLAYNGYSALKNGAIFEARDEQTARLKAKDLSKEPTGLEPMQQEALGVKKADNK